MTVGAREKGGRRPAQRRAPRGDAAHRKFVLELSPEERVLLDLRDEIFGGAWDELERCLEDRLQGRPYILRLATRIEEDLERIRRMRGYEAAQQVDIGRYRSGTDAEERTRS